MNRTITLLILSAAFLVLPTGTRTEEKTFRIGIIGLDTSHVIAFTELINNPNKNYGCKVVAGFPGGSLDIPSSINRVEGYTKQLRERQKHSTPAVWLDPATECITHAAFDFYRCFSSYGY